MSSVDILVVPRRVFDEVGPFQGFREGAAAYLDAFFAAGVAEFRPRAEMEADPAYKQLIPYVVLTCDGGVFAYTRGRAGGESRLHDRRSVGVGGHVDAGDLAPGRPVRQAYIEAVARELAEEVVIGARAADLGVIGLINDDGDAVGRVHLGVVHRLELERPEAVANEDALRDAGFVPLVEAAADPRFEAWSRLVLAHLLSR
jgi:predicted NUDIX family phosphoesterase